MTDIRRRTAWARADARLLGASSIGCVEGSQCIGRRWRTDLRRAAGARDLQAYWKLREPVGRRTTGEVMADLLDEAKARFRELESYRATLHSAGRDGDWQVMHYFYLKPGWVRIECVEPHRGAVLIFDPGARKLRLWTFGLGWGWGFGFVPALSLAPDNPLVRSPRGHTVDRSDVGALFDNLQTLRTGGSLTPLGAGTIAGEPTVGFEVAGAAGLIVGGAHRNRVWLARDTLFPRRVESFDEADELVETVDLVDAELDVVFPERFFAP